jgi:hypothetical protein
MRFVVALAFGVMIGCSSSGSSDDPGSSAECQEFCQRASQCGTCGPKNCVAHNEDLCPAGTLARLKCEAEKGTWQCIGSGGWAVVFSCSDAIQAACNPADAATDSATDSKTDSTSTNDSADSGG